jgi:hypothetical protein
VVTVSPDDGRPDIERDEAGSTNAREADAQLGKVHDLPPGPLAASKSAGRSPCGLLVPTGDEVESAQLLANEARGTLHRYGLDDLEILELADDFVAEDRGNDTEDFVGWARYMHAHRLRSHAWAG